MTYFALIEHVHSLTRRDAGLLVTILLVSVISWQCQFITFYLHYFGNKYDDYSLFKDTR